MDEQFFQLLRRIQKEERNKSTLARVDKDFYKQLYSYIRALERSVANDPFGNDQLLLNNAQRIATEICETRESKISKAANNNIYRSFHLFKKENPQFDLIDTTPLNLTDEEETLYFSLMDALRTHRYNISLDKFGEEKTSLSADDYEEDDEDEFEDDYEENIVKSRVNQGVVSDEEFFKDDDSKIVSGATDGFSGESISVEESEAGVPSANSVADSGAASSVIASGTKDSVIASGVDVNVVDSSYGSTDASAEDSILDDSSEESSFEAIDSNLETVDSSLDESGDVSNVETVDSSLDESDEVLNRLNQIKNSTVVTDEKYEPIEKQINNQAKVVPNVSMENDFRYAPKEAEGESKIDSKPVKPEAKAIEDRPQRKSSSTLDFDSIFANPDSQFDSIHNFEPDYEADFANIQASSSFAEPSEADLMFSTKPRPKKESKPKSPSFSKPAEGDSKPVGVDSKPVGVDSKPVGVDSKLSEVDSKPIGMDSKPAEAQPQAQRPKSNIKAFAKKEELENTAVVILKDISSFMGIDEKIYGPFLANDVVILPNITAQILIDNNKAGLIDI